MKKYYNGEELSYKEKLFSVIGIKNKKDLDKICEGDRVLMEVSKKIEELSLDDIMVDLYDVEKDRQMAEKAREEYRREQMEKEVREEMQKEMQKEIEKAEKGKALEIAKNLLQIGMDIKEVERYTGITEEENKKLT